MAKAPVPDWAKVSKDQVAEAVRLKLPVAFESAYTSEDAVEPSGAASGDMRVLRGRSWVHEAKWVRAAARHQTIPNDEYHIAGFRLVAAAAAP